MKIATKVAGLLLFLLCGLAQAGSLNECFNSLEYDAELHPIKDKVSLVSSDTQTFGMLANEATPTSDETQAIYKWATKREQCLKSYPPPNNPLTQVNREGFNSIQSLILDLYKGNLTYGQFARQRREIAKMVEAKTQEIIGQYQQQQMQQQQQQRQFCETRYQQCLNRAKDIYARNACQMENAGCGIGNLLNR